MAVSITTALRESHQEMINRLEIHSTWNGLVQSWKEVWQASELLERWAAFASYCDRLLALARADNVIELETALHPLLDVLGQLKAPGGGDKASVDALLPAVYAVVRKICSEIGRTAERETEAALPIVVMLVRDAEAVRELLLQIEHYGYVIRAFEDYQAGSQFAIAQRAVAVIVDIDSAIDGPATACMEGLNRAGIKWFALATEDSFAMRLQAVRAMGHGFFVVPLSVNALIDAIDPLVYKTKDEPYRILALDDSATVLATIARTLSQFPNIHLSTLRQPEAVLEALVDFSPDVLLLDFHMHGCTGLEVARIIRQNKAFESIPIVYLTGETRQDVQHEAMRAGGDDFLTKPISKAQLVNAVLSKAERYRGLRRLMVEDSLTGLYNHVHTKTLLEQSLLLAHRQNVPVSYAILDIDHFKRVNDTYGHSVGDTVIKSLARLLKQKTRQSDVVGRYGGEEFVIILFGCTPARAFDHIESIRKDFSELQHAGDNGRFCATLSAGIAHYPAYDSMMELMVAADDALYAAKRGGRNQVMLADRSGC